MCCSAVLDKKEVTEHRTIRKGELVIELSNKNGINIYKAVQCAPPSENAKKYMLGNDHTCKALMLHLPAQFQQFSSS